MSAVTYTRLELRRSLRNRRFFLFSLGFPVVFFLVFAISTGKDNDFAGSGISNTVFYLAGLISFGTMAAMIGTGARISVERVSGWNRQLRLTPLKSTTYFTSKMVVSYVIVLVTIVVLSALALALGASLNFGHWLEMVGLVIVAAIPFAGLGIGVGHLLSPDAMGPVLGSSVGLLAFLGGSWFPLGGTLKTIGELLPSYWIAAAGHTAAGGPSWSLEGWIVEAVWIVLALTFASWAYKKDTKRV